MRRQPQKRWGTWDEGWRGVGQAFLGGTPACPGKGLPAQLGHDQAAQLDHPSRGWARDLPGSPVVKTIYVLLLERAQV